MEAIPAALMNMGAKVVTTMDSAIVLSGAPRT